MVGWGVLLPLTVAPDGIVMLSVPEFVACKVELIHIRAIPNDQPLGNFPDG